MNFKSKKEARGKNQVFSEIFLKTHLLDERPRLNFWGFRKINDLF